MGILNNITEGTTQVKYKDYITCENIAGSIFTQRWTNMSLIWKRRQDTTSLAWFTLAPEDSRCLITVTWPSWAARKSAVAPSCTREIAPNTFLKRGSWFLKKNIAHLRMTMLLVFLCSQAVLSATGQTLILPSVWLSSLQKPDRLDLASRVSLTQASKTWMNALRSADRERWLRSSRECPPPSSGRAGRRRWALCHRPVTNTHMQKKQKKGSSQV